MLPFAEDLDAEKIHVQAPSDIIFLCGGLISDLAQATPLSLRDAFYKIIDNPVLRDRELILAENVTKELLFFDKYRDILALETDLAQIVELILLFCESEGSLAELGAFSVIDEIASRLFVVVRAEHWESDSFIKLGPLRKIEIKYSRDSIFVVHDDQIGLRRHSAADVDKDKLKKLLDEPLRKRLGRVKEPTTFDPNRSGHLIKLIVGFVQEYGALDVNEIQDLLELFNIPNISIEDIRRFAMCSNTVGWTKEVPRGSRDYIVAANTRVSNWRRNDASPPDQRHAIAQT